MVQKSGLSFFVITFLLLQCLSGQEQDTSNYQMTPLFMSGDSIVVESNDKGEILYRHILREKQTLYSLSNFFGWDVFSLYDFNPELNTQIASVGDTILVPIKGQAISQSRHPFRDYIEVYYKVKKKDNPFAVRHRLFNIEKEQFYALNPESRSGLSIGQKVFVGYIPLNGMKRDSTFKYSPLMNNVHKKMASVFRKYDDRRLSEKKGMAYWNPEEKNQSGFFVICDKAPLNSYVEITNPMYGRSAYARVISHLPSKAFPQEVMVVVSPSLANYLGVMDSRFFVKMRYLHQNK